MSYSWIFCHETIWITTRLLIASLPAIFVPPPVTPVGKTLSALVVERVLTRASANLLGLLLAYSYSHGSSRHSTLGCKEKQTPVPCQLLG